MNFKVGDKVKIREGLSTDRRYGELWVLKEMEEFLGKEARIISTDNLDEHYTLDVDNGRWGWTDEMLEPIEDPLVNKIIERNNKHSGGLTDDKVNSPSHYTRGDIEVIDIIKQLTQGYEPFEAYLVGNTIKYLARANFKENKQQDLEKAEWHINKLLEEQNK